MRILDHRYAYSDYGVCTHACTRPQDLYKSKNYNTLYYKQNGSIGIRRKHVAGEPIGKQLFSFGASSGWTERRIRKLAARVLRKLDDGESTEIVCAWAQGQVA